MEKGGIEDLFKKQVPRSLYRSYNATKHVITFYNGEFAVAIGRHHIHDSETSVVTRRKRLMQIALDAVYRLCPNGFTGCAQNSPPTLTPQPERASQLLVKSGNGKTENCT